MKKRRNNKENSKFKIILLLFGILFFHNCNKYQFNNELIQIKVNTSILDCEETNIHLRVIDSKSIKLSEKSILPICDGNLDCEKEFYNIRDTTKIFLIEGYLSKKAHSIFDYGCTDAKVFKILNFTQITH